MPRLLPFVFVLGSCLDTAISISFPSIGPTATFSLGKGIDRQLGLLAPRNRSEPSKPLARTKWAVVDNAEAVRAAGASEWAHNVCAFVIYSAFLLMLLSIVVWFAVSYQRYRLYHLNDDCEFSQYVKYKFADWFVITNYAAPLVVTMLSLSVIVLGSLLYSILVGGSPVHALYKVFIWAFAAESGDEETAAGRFMGVLITGCGLVILSILLGIVAEGFASRMQAIRNGLVNVVEGGHVVLVGHSECTRCLIEELANAWESEGGGVFVVLTVASKSEIEDDLLGSDLNMRNSRVIVRTGAALTIRDLLKANVDAAAQVVLLADTNVSREEADAKSMRTALALKTKNWPSHGRIVVQCSSVANHAVFRNVDKKMEVVVVGDIVAKLMVQSCRHPGLAVVFGQMLGFEGDEFYNKEWPELVGCRFLEATFRFPDAVVLGVFDVTGACRLNPGWDYEIKVDDRIIVLAEDDSCYQPVDEPYFFIREGSKEEGLNKSSSEGFSPDISASPVTILLFGWNDKVPTLLKALDNESASGSIVTIVSPRGIAYREEELEKLRERNENTIFRNVSVAHVYTDEVSFTSRAGVEKLKHWTFDHIIILADAKLHGRIVADDFVVAIFLQMQTINATLPEDVKRLDFQPVIELCEDHTSEHLKMCGAKNLIYSNSLVSKALAAVTYDGSVNAIYTELLAAVSNEFHISDLSEFLQPGAEVPTEVSFGELVYLISLAGAALLLGWTESSPSGEQEWTMNPKDKVARRPWTHDDKVAVIRKMRLPS